MSYKNHIYIHSSSPSCSDIYDSPLSPEQKAKPAVKPNLRVTDLKSFADKDSLRIRKSRQLTAVIVYHGLCS